MNQEPLLIIRGLSHSYGSRPALQEVDFTVSKGCIFGLLGPNGSGKTTLFRILSTLLDPDAGEIILDGIHLREDRDGIRQKIGVVFQSPSLDKKLTVAENLRHQGRLYGMSGPELERRMEVLMGRFQIADRANEMAETLSGGLQRRVEIAKSLLHSPGVLILDEPSTGLDPGARRELWSFLQEINLSEKVTILVTTHLMDEAERCHQLLIMDEGRQVVLDTPAALKSLVTGTVITVRSADPHLFKEKIQTRFSVASVIVEDGVRLEWNHTAGTKSAGEWAGQLMEIFGKEIESLTLAQPTLEDVFIQKTGRAFFVDGLENG